MFVSYEYISYSKGLCLFMTNTLIAPFLASHMLKERIKRWDIIGILLGFCGMIFLIQPWKTKDEGSNVGNNFVGCCFGLGASFSAAVAFFYQKRLADDIHFTIQPFYYTLTANLFNSIWGFTAPSSKVARYSIELYMWSIGGACIILGS